MPGKTLIVGAGLAGTLTAWGMYKRGEDFSVYDNGNPSASLVAAGIFNPVSFKRVVEVWNAEEHMKVMLETYIEIEDELGVKFLNKLPIIRIFPNEQYRDHWKSRLESGHEVAKWISPIQNEVPEGVVAPFGFGLVKNAGWVNLPKMIEGIKSKFPDRFDQNSWKISDGIPEKFDRVIDCRGVGAKKELNNLGYKLASDHGEVLTLKSTNFAQQDYTINKIKWLMPFQKNLFKLGATYTWGLEESKPTVEGKIELLETIKPALKPSISENFEVVNHESGLRPTSHDRRPYVGELENNSGIFILNGLGTRGVLVAPLMVKKLVDQIFN